LFRIGLWRFYSGWKNVLLIVKPDTVGAWIKETVGDEMMPSRAKKK
jgi:hypothetical protein